MGYLTHGVPIHKDLLLKENLEHLFNFFINSCLWEYIFGDRLDRKSSIQNSDSTHYFL